MTCSRFGFYSILQILEHPVAPSHGVVSEQFMNTLVLEQHAMIAEPKLTPFNPIHSDNKTLVGLS